MEEGRRRTCLRRLSVECEWWAAPHQPPLTAARNARNAACTQKQTACAFGY